MSHPAQADSAPQICFPEASIDDYCRSILKSAQREMWWFQIGNQFYSGFSRPFQDSDDVWWWRAKPQFAYPVDLLQTLETRRSMPKTKTLVGWQARCPETHANSRLRFNIIEDLPSYNLKSLERSKQKGVRRGLRDLTITKISTIDRGLADEARRVWDSHVGRTSWSKALTRRNFDKVWHPLSDTPGTTVIGAFRRDEGSLCAWMILRHLSGTIYCDTIASATSARDARPNDTLIYVALSEAASSGARHANGFRVSSITGIEKFKQSMGFDTNGMPAYVHLSPLTRLVPPPLRPTSWKQLLSDGVTARLGSNSVI